MRLAGQPSFTLSKWDAGAVLLLCGMECIGTGCQKAIKEIVDEAELGGFWLWLNRKDMSGKNTLKTI